MGTKRRLIAAAAAAGRCCRRRTFWWQLQARPPPVALSSLQAKEKKGLSKYDESKGVQRRGEDDTPLDDPIAEKLRQQRLIEESDYQATMELFGAGACRALRPPMLSVLPSADVIAGRWEVGMSACRGGHCAARHAANPARCVVRRRSPRSP